MRERETKMMVDPSVQLPPLEELLDGFGSWTTSTTTLTAVYFDTADLRLTRSGVSLRFRSDDGWTVKTPQAEDFDGLLRDEHSFGDAAGEPPDPALELVTPWARSELLAEVARIETRRTRVRVLDTDGRLLNEIDDDSVLGTPVGAEPVRFREVEVETPEGGDPDIGKLVIRRLRAAGAGTGPSRPKIARILGDRATAPPDLVPAPDLGHDPTTTDLVRASISTAVRSLVEHDAVVRAGLDPEGVHRARVATRRLRSHLHTFRPLVDETWSESLRNELQWFGKQLGYVRDADVLLAKLQARAERLPEDLRDHADVLTDRLRTARDRDHRTLLEAMRSPAYVTLLDHLIDAAATPHMRGDHRDRRAADSVRRLTRHPWKRLRTSVHGLSDHPTTGELHAVRIRAKQTRYAYEACAPVIGKSARRIVKRLTVLQDLLGDHHDATVAIEWLHAAVTDELAPEVVFVAGAIAATFTEDHRRVEATWRAAWRRVEHVI